MIAPSLLEAGPARGPLAGVLAGLIIRLRTPTSTAPLAAGTLPGPETPGAVVDRGSMGTTAGPGSARLLFPFGQEIDLRRLAAAGRTHLVPGLLRLSLRAHLRRAPARRKGEERYGDPALREEVLP